MKIVESKRLEREEKHRQSIAKEALQAEADEKRIQGILDGYETVKV